MNRFIAEKVMGLEGWYCPVCQYEEECTICGCHIVDPDYTTPADYFALLQKAIGSEWWYDFWKYAFHRFSGFIVENFIKWLLAPENFARLVAEYHGWKEEGK